MSTLTLANITTANGTTNLTLATGNTSNPSIVISAATGAASFGSNTVSSSPISATAGAVAAVVGSSNGSATPGVYGTTTNATGYGVIGTALGGYGVYATSNTGVGLVVQSNTGTIAQFANATNSSIFTITNAGAITGGKIITGTVISASANTFLDFTGIPSWARRVTLMFSAVSMSATADILVQLGSGSVQTTGYSSVGSGIATTVATTASTAGFIVGNTGALLAANFLDGQMIFNILATGTNTWAGSGSFAMRTTPQTMLSSGVVSLVGALDRLRITSVANTATFDAGSININWE